MVPLFVRQGGRTRALRTCLVLAQLAILPLAHAAEAIAIAAEDSFLLDSRPSGALVFINGAEVGLTPYLHRYTYASLTKSELIVELRLSGYDPVEVNVGMLLKDMYARRRPYVVNLYRDHSGYGKKIDLPVIELQDSIPKGADLGTVGKRKLERWSDELGPLTNTDELTSAIRRAFYGSFANAQNARRATVNGDELIRRAKIYLQPVLREVLFQATDIEGFTYGDVDVEMEWRIMSGVDPNKLLFSIRKRTRWQAFQESNEDRLLELALEDAAHQFIDEEGLMERMRTATQIKTVVDRGDTVEITRPTGIPFEGRRDMLAALVQGVVTIKTDKGHGSGFVISNDGYIVTNAHVVQEQSTVKVKFNQGFTLDGQVVKVNPDFDLALIKTPGEHLPALELGTDTALLVGEELFAIGTPLGEELGQTVTRGIMSGWREFEGRTYIQTDVSINRGNSGGPVIDENGKVVGVATLKVNDARVQGIGFAVPVSRITEMLSLKFK